MNRISLTALAVTILFILVMAASAFGSQQWISLNGTSEPNKPTATIVSSNDQETIVRIKISGFWTSQRSENDEQFTSLRFPGYATTLEIGKPALPVVSELMGIPGGAHVSASVVDSRHVTLTGYNVYPFQTPLHEGEKRVTFDIDRSFYQQNAFYPEVMAQVGDPGIWRDLRVVNLKVNPLAYNPATGELRACSEITVKLEYSGKSDVNVKSPSRRPIAENYDSMYRQSVLNYGYLESVTEVGDLDALCDYLIIADDDYLTNMAPFISWKNTQGYATSLVAVSQVGTTYTAIKNYIANEYNTNGIRYVLLVGNASDIPAYTDYGYFSDYYYTLLDGNDDYADIAIGRFSVDDPEHVDNMVSKSIAFESSPPAGDWLEKALLVANWEDAPLKYQQCTEQIRTAEELPAHTYDMLYPNFTTAYGAAFEDGGDEASNQDVIDYINQGFRLVNYRGHGDAVSWQNWNVYNQYFRVSDVGNINNGDLTPVVFSIACNNNDLLYSSTTIGETFTQGDNCAVAYLGASSPSYTDPNHDYDKQLNAVVFNEGTNAIGDATNEASVRTINLWGTYGVANAQMYLWLGDPSLQLMYDFVPGPPAPALVSPDHGAYYDPPVQVLLDWDESDGAVSYHVQVDNNSDFCSLESDVQGIVGTEWTTPSLPLGNYFWRVRATHESSYGLWSEVRRIDVGLVMQAPVLLSPSDGSRMKNKANIALEWTAIEGVSGYDIEIDNNSKFTSPNQIGYSEDCSGGECVYYIDPVLQPFTYYWRVKAAMDEWPWSEAWSLKLTGRVFKDGDNLAMPTQVELHANYPNPFNPSTEISFGLPETGHVRLDIFNIMGQKVTTLVDRSMSAGYHTVTWNGRTSASGVYLYRLATDETVINRKMLLIK